jgi:site-specific DNA-methyltransferase (adenine-specific)
MILLWRFYNLEYNEIIKDSYYHDRTGMLLKGDCLEWMAKFPDKSVDMILADLPYGTTACKWDVVIPFEPLWNQYERIIKDSGAIVLTCAQPFTSFLISSNIKLFKYCWYWKKSPTGFLNAKKMPMKAIEDICVFYNSLPSYNPQGLIRVDKKKKNADSKRKKTGVGLSTHNGGRLPEQYFQEFSNYPNQLLCFSNDKGLHPTQKPVLLFEYLVKTYTNEGEIVLDNTAGACTTAIACKNTNRKWICIEKEEEYCIKSVERIKSLGQ